MSEVWDLYDKDKNFIGKQHKRGNQLNVGEYHLATEVWVVNDNRKILITRRHPSKNFGGLWEASGGAVLSGEDSITGAKRELFEEVGIDSADDSFFLLGTFIGTDWIMDTYLFKKNISVEQLKLQKEEVIDAKWVDIIEFDEMGLKESIVPSVLKRFNLYRDRILQYIHYPDTTFVSPDGGRKQE